MITLASTPPKVVPAARPLLKWVGGKARLLPYLAPLYEPGRSVIEPFFGGGALSFHLAGSHSGLPVVANDWLEPLMGVYRAVQSDVKEFISGVEAFALPYLERGTREERREFYYETREKYATGEQDEPWVLFFLLRCAYSGLYRSAKKYPGRFYTPHGMGEEKRGFYFPDRLYKAHGLMESWTLSAGDFMSVLERVDHNSFVFLDPPYRGTFDGYTGVGFTDEQQEQVVEFFKEAHRRGARVVYTNKELGDGFYRDRFAGFNLSHVPIKYQVNGDGMRVGRPETLEVLVHNVGM